MHGTKASGEQVGAGLGEADEGPAFVHFDPAPLNRESKPRRILRRCRLVAEQERAVEHFDVNPAVLYRRRVRAASGGARPFRDWHMVCRW